MKPVRTLIFVTLVFFGLGIEAFAAEEEFSTVSQRLSAVTATFAKYCVDCHGASDATADLNLEEFDSSVALAGKPWDATEWEKIVKRLRARQMPPADADRPSEAEYEQLLATMESVLDRSAEQFPRPGNTDPIRRLNRTEYRNAIRDLLAVDINVDDLLPADQLSHGFDNITVSELSPVLLNRYITAAQQTSRLAVGGRQRSPGGITVRLPADLTQESHVEGLPLGTRGGTLVKHQFPATGEYEIQLRLMRDRDENLEGLNQPADIDVLLDRELVHRFNVKPPKSGKGYQKDDTLVDANLKKRFRVTAGPHRVGVTFPQSSSSLSEIKRQPFDASFNRHRHPRKNPAIFEVSIVGPFDPEGPGDTPSRRRIFGDSSQVGRGSLPVQEGTGGDAHPTNTGTGQETHPTKTVTGGDARPTIGQRSLADSLPSIRSPLLHSPSGRVEPRRGEGDRTESSPRRGSTLLGKEGEANRHDSGTGEDAKTVTGQETHPTKTVTGGDARPTEEGDAADTAEQIFRRLIRLAYRRPVADDDLVVPMQFFQERLVADGFEPAIESGLAAILINPHFLFRVENTPAEVEPKAAYRISDVELASRLSFFLWSSIPDDQLLTLAEANRLHEPEVLHEQVDRMLRDERSQSLVTNFAAQWLYLRNLDSFRPDMRLFADFDDNLRKALRRETELLFEHVLREDHSVLQLIRSDTTFLNERLAKHYGIAGVLGSHFRPVDVSDDSLRRGGLLRHGSILAVTSYATRTSPTIRGNWILENILGTPAPPPPPNVPALKEKKTSTNVTVRERLAEHRENPACASCHDLMDPVGFALEHYDAVGRWRLFDQGLPVDSSGALPDGKQLSGLADLEAGIMERPEMFVSTLTEKLLTFALGRGIESYDAPAIRRIVRESADTEYSLSSLVKGIASSPPFQMRVAE